ncbi:hypothetical protein J1N35_043993 [Gossypium stocksii]|uniref:Uncharacterized protein n=1 Tax=Gossypium stocksii TaxID=47602 RepID=A0A9D3ZFI2_9ROSI|nr:hypothetical protein J1N35_043993 [Gossypium stocksii]
MHLSKGTAGDLNHLLSGIEPCISAEDNAKLTLKYTEKEVWMGIKEMGSTKASERMLFQPCSFKNVGTLLEGMLRPFV